MGYQRSNGEWAATEDLVLAASAARTATADGDAVDVGDHGTVRLTLDVTAASGTSPTLDVVVETSEDATTWRTLTTFTQKTGVASERISVGGADRHVRARWTVGGTSPSFTFEVAGEAA